MSKEGMPTTQAELEDVLNEHSRRTTGDAVKAAVSDVLSKNGA